MVLIGARPAIEIRTLGLTWQGLETKPRSSYAFLCSGSNFPAMILRSGGNYGWTVRFIAVVAFPISSPETTSSTRRFCWRPAAVSFVVTGFVFPKPAAVTLFDAIPFWTK